MKRSAYDKRQRELLERLRRRVKENSEFPDKPRVTKTKTYEFFVFDDKMMKVK